MAFENRAQALHVIRSNLEFHAIATALGRNSAAPARLERRLFGRLRIFAQPITL
jgi:hypothetical protein